MPTLGTHCASAKQPLRDCCYFGKTASPPTTCFYISLVDEAVPVNALICFSLFSTCETADVICYRACLAHGVGRQGGSASSPQHLEEAQQKQKAELTPLPQLLRFPLRPQGCDLPSSRMWLQSESTTL